MSLGPHCRASAEGRARAGAEGDDLVSRLLSARDSDTGETMDVQQVRDEALIFLLAGHETTSTALTFTLQLLGRHPDEQARIHGELDAVLGGRAPAAHDVPALQCTAMAIKEAMRLYPPAKALVRRAELESEIGGYVIPAGADVLVSQYATHRHPVTEATLTWRALGSAPLRSRSRPRRTPRQRWVE